MDIGQFSESKYLKKEDVNAPTSVTIKSIEKANVAMDNQAPDYKCVITFNEFEKPMVCNNTNLKRFAKIYGSTDTENWIGKVPVSLYVGDMVEFQGKIVGGLRVRPAEQQQAAPPADFDDSVPF